MRNKLIKNNAVPSGLTSKEVALRLEKYGKNFLESKNKTNYFLLFLTLVFTPISSILLAAATITLVLEQTNEAVIIFAIVLLTASLDFFQEYRSGEAAAKLSKKLARNCVAIRNGVKQEIPVFELVPEDIVFISTGDILPADGELLDLNDSLLINESALTGESFPLEKNTTDQVLASTIVVSGWGYFKVLKTGKNTRIGGIAKNLNTVSPLNSFEIGARNFSNLIFKATIILVSIVLIINLAKIYILGQPLDQNSILQILLFSLAIAVGLTPELLPVIISINKSHASILMSKRGVLVKHLDSIPDFGSMDVLCTDKTGTLTEDKISLVQHLDVEGKSSKDVLLKGYLNSLFQSGLKSPLDEAILDFEHEDIQFYQKIDELPYDFNRRRLSVIVSRQQKTTLITKGQFEEVLKICNQYKIKDTVYDLNIEQITQFKLLYNSLSSQRFRVLAVAEKAISVKDKYAVSLEESMILIGFLAFLDPAKTSVKSALTLLHQSGISVKIITGDNELVTTKICQDIGLKISGVITGEAAAMLDDLEFAKVAETCNIFARFNPEQKKRTIEILRKQHVVGYMGDGINDAPSLKAADVGISVNNAVDVARESADIILLNKDLKVLLSGIYEGRRTFNNTTKYILMAISSNFGNMFSIVGAALFLPFLPMLPIQILLNNSLYDLSQLAIPSDLVDEEYLHSPQKWDIGFIKRFMIVFGLLSSIFDFILFFVMYNIFHLDKMAFQTAWFLESLATQIMVIYIIRTRKIPFVQSLPSKWLVVNTLTILLVAFILPFIAIGQYFNFYPLSLSMLGAIVLISVIYLMTAEFVKQIFYTYKKIIV